MPSNDYAISTDAFTIDGTLYAAETLDFSLPARTIGTFPVNLSFDGMALTSAKIIIAGPGESGVELFGHNVILQTPFFPIPTMTGQTTMGFDDSFPVTISGMGVYTTGKIEVTGGVGLPEPASLFLLLPALAYIGLRSRRAL